MSLANLTVQHGRPVLFDVLFERIRPVTNDLGL
jgi:hypothetical protein